MGKRYKHLSLMERDRITELRFKGMSFREIAKELGRSPSTLSREFKRNATPAYKVYLSHRAHERAVIRKKESGVRPRLKDERIVSYVRSRLAEDWSLELIAGRISLVGWVEERNPTSFHVNLPGFASLYPAYKTGYPQVLSIHPFPTCVGNDKPAITNHIILLTN